jgi:hypothetical protein
MGPLSLMNPTGARTAGGGGQRPEAAPKKHRNFIGGRRWRCGTNLAEQAGEG